MANKGANTNGLVSFCLSAIWALSVFVTDVPVRPHHYMTVFRIGDERSFCSLRFCG